VRHALASLGARFSGRFALGEMEDAADALLVILNAIDEELSGPSAGGEGGASGGAAALKCLPAATRAAAATFGATISEFTNCPSCHRKWSATRYQQLTQAVAVFPLLEAHTRAVTTWHTRIAPPSPRTWNGRVPAARGAHTSSDDVVAPPD